MGAGKILARLRFAPPADKHYRLPSGIVFDDLYQDRTLLCCYPPNARQILVRQDMEGVGDGTTIERRYCISSLPGTDAKGINECVRGDWGV